VGEFNSSRLFMPSALKLWELTHEGGEAGFMIFAIKPSHVPSLKRRFNRKVEEATKRTGLESNIFDNLSVIGSWLIFQKEVVFEQRKIWRNS
jgi:hypothetical protein